MRPIHTRSHFRIGDTQLARVFASKDITEEAQSENGIYDKNYLSYSTVIYYLINFNEQHYTTFLGEQNGKIRFRFNQAH